MKKLTKQLFSLINKIYIFLTSGIWLEGVIFRSCIRGIKGNDIKTLKYFVKSNLKINGIANVVSNEGYIKHSSITIIGNNNALTIHNDSSITASNIVIRANNATIEIGKNTRILSNCRLVCQGNNNDIHIGDNCLFSTDVDIWNSDTHTIQFMDGAVLNPSKPVYIGDHVWLGKGCAILKGVHIGSDSVIGMKSLVTKSIESNSIAAGIPAKVIKRRITWDKKYIEEVQL